jgi:hypothetical protein
VRPPLACTSTGQSFFIQQASSMLWMLKSLNPPPLAQRKLWKR